MPDYDLYVLADFNATGTTVSLVAGYDGSNDTLLTIEDGPALNDNILDGDSTNDEAGNDPDQFGVATLASGATIGSLASGVETTVYSEEQYELTAPGETTITLFRVEIEGQLVGFLPTTPLVPGVVYSYTGTNTVPGNSFLYDDIVGAVCFVRGTFVSTPNGRKRIENLSIDDRVQTLDGSARVRWIGSRRYKAVDLAHNHNLLPIRIQAGALGNDLPKRDLLVSRQHRLLVASKIVQRVCGTSEALVAAIKLTGLHGVSVETNVHDVEYFHILCDQHEIVFAEGAPSESMFVGPEALKTLPKETIHEVVLMFPELMENECALRPARTIPSGADQKKIITRHIKNNHELLSGWNTSVDRNRTTWIDARAPSRSLDF